MKWSTRRVLASAAVVAALGGGGAAYATTHGGARTKSVKAARAETPFITAVASRVGVDPQKLLDAIKAEATARVDAALAAGKLPAESATRIKARIAAATLDHPRGLAGPRMHGGKGPRRAIGKAAADYLGIQRDALRQELMSGKSLAQIATIHGKSVDGLKAAIVKAVTERLDQAVADGRATKELEQRVLDRVKAHLDEIVNRAGSPGPRGRLLLPRP